VGGEKRKGEKGKKEKGKRKGGVTQLDRIFVQTSSEEKEGRDRGREPEEERPWRGEKGKIGKEGEGRTAKMGGRAGERI